MSGHATFETIGMNDAIADRHGQFHGAARFLPLEGEQTAGATYSKPQLAPAVDGAGCRTRLSSQIGAKNLHNSLAEVGAGCEQAGGRCRDLAAMQAELIQTLLGRVEIVRPKVSQCRIPDLASCSPLSVKHPEPHTLSPLLEIGCTFFVKYEWHKRLPQREGHGHRRFARSNSGRPVGNTTSAEWSSSGPKSHLRKHTQLALAVTALRRG